MYKEIDMENTIELSLNDPKTIKELTNNTCWRPDLFFKGSKTCDLCGLFPHCDAISTKKVSKNFTTSQVVL